MSAPAAAATTDAATGPAASTTLAVVAGVGSASLPGDLRAAAKAAGTPRQVLRFLDGMALPAFVAGTLALGAAGVEDGETCGVFTVSGWDPEHHAPDLGAEPADHTAVARHYITTASPLTWLRKMVNNALCHLAVVHGLRGPNNHVVGSAGALAAVLALGRRAIDTGAATHVLIVAYDAPPGGEREHEVDGDAAALVLGPAVAPRGAESAPTAGPGGSPWAVGAPAGAGRPAVRAVDALDALVAASATRETDGCTDAS